MNEEELKQCFDILQEQNDKLYNDLGATDEVIDLQVSINKLRNKYNIPDANTITESNPGFAQ